MIDFKTFNIKLETKKDKEIEIFGGNKVKVRQFISSNEKRDLLLITLQQSLVDHIINPFYLDINFHVNLIKMYSDIVFQPEDIESNFELYDKLVITEIYDAVIAAIPEEDYNELQEYLTILVEKYEKYSLSAFAIVNSMLEQLPNNVKSAEDAVKSFDPETLKQIVELAKATGYKQD